MTMWATCRALARNAGLDPRRWRTAWRGWLRYRRDRSLFRAAAPGLPWGREQPILTEYDAESGETGPYFHQDLHVARWIREDAPERLIDVGSRIDGFIGNVATFREVEVIDIRPQRSRIPGVTFRQMDLMHPLAPEWIASTDALSCLHTIEHFGLGRYGDPIDPQGHLKGLEQLKLMVKPGGRLYFSTPVGPERVEFNAHRIFDARTVLGWFGEGWRIERLSVLTDDQTLLEDLSPSAPEAATNFGCQAGILMLTASRQQGGGDKPSGGPEI